MSNCNNCFNGCTETISDQCIRYTGIDVPELGISNGDPLSVIEQALTTFLVSALNGSGIKIDLSSIDVCTLVQQYLPTCGEMSIADISKALIQASCNLQEQIDAIDATLDTLNADYTIGCLTGVTSSSDTHAVLQATITKLCSVSADVDSLSEQLPLYVQQSELCTLVEECVNNNNGTALASSKMLPYSVIPYYGAISGYPTVSDGFSSTGAGYGYWLNVYVCNGQNPGVPDLRGRVAVGSTDMFGSNWPTQTNPSGPGNPTYGYKTSTSVQGNNTITLSLPQIPAHSHTGSTAVTTISPATHSHFTVGPSQGNVLTSSNTISQGNGGAQSLGYALTGFNGAATIGKSSDVALSATTTLTMLSNGQGEAHSNVQPGLAVYYLIYIPA
jgi:microcystin-dependent protein